MDTKAIGRTLGASTICIALAAAVLGCPDPDDIGANDAGTLPQTLYVGMEGQLASYDLATGEQRPGSVTSYASPTSLMPLDDGTVIVNLTGSNEVVAVNPETMEEVARVPSSGAAAVKPVHGFLSPARDGKQYWLALNDGKAGEANTSSARFISVTKGPDYLQPKGEVVLGASHHKATFSSTQQRVVISNMADCATVLGVYDYSNPDAIQTLKTWSAADLGWTAADPGAGNFNPKFCDTTYQRGTPPAPHGCATSKVSKAAYCNLTSSGAIAAVKLDASPPTVSLITTTGSGSGYTIASHDGRFIYSVQKKPREGAGGGTCQMGQLVIINAETDTVVSQTPLLYKGAGCTTALKGTDEELVEPGHMQLTHDGKTLYVTPAGAFGVATARVRQELVVDIADPASPLQKASIAIGAGTGHVGDGLSGDGKFLFTANNVDNTVSIIDTATNTVVRTLTVPAKPVVVTSYGSAEGPGHQMGPIH